ncbi:MAG: PBP1A family penicillin-binding protein [Burkholderiaceae bacterium]|nr:PBP1A family penicillin-binding protein [Burkholderiaceae bacterium]
MTAPFTAETTAGSADHHPHRPLLRKLLIGGLGALMAAVALLVALVAWYAPQLPSLEPVTTYQPRQPLQVFTADGVEIAQFGTERRRFVAIDEIPPLMQQAVLAVEDARFYEHSGIDLKGLARALLAQFTGGMRQGASTITQQVARTFFLSQRFTPERKIKEVLLALEIERRLSKPQILELYMNQIYLGQRSYGFAAAADTYFGKPLDLLTIAEAAMLAGLPQNPHYANPITNLERATQRQRIVLARMVATGAITPEQQDGARAERLKLRTPSQQALHAEHVAEMARRLVVERFGTEAYSQGLRVQTSLRSADQQAAWAAVRRGVLAYDARQPWRGPEGNEALPDARSPDLEAAAAQALKDYRDDEDLRVAIVLQASPREILAQLASGERVTLRGDALRVAQPGLAPRASAALAVRRGAVLRLMQTPGRDGQADAWSVVQWPEVQAALVSLDAASGRVRALVGGFDFARQPFNHVTQARRQPGSAFKPFLYSAALEHGVMPATLVNDVPYTSADGWQPQNSDGSFDGPITLRQALARSKNLVSIRVLQQVGVADARAWAERFGFTPDSQPANLTLALGAGSTSPLQLARAYAVLANGGWAVAPVVIERISDAKGSVLFEAPAARPADEAGRAVPARNVFVTDSLLNDVTRIGTAARAQAQLGRGDLYGKTGTTNEAVDAWFAGFQAGAGRGLVAVVWIGHDEPQSLGSRESGGGLALPVWIDYMARALDGVPVAPPPEPPEGVVRRDDDWVYAEWADGGMVSGIGLDSPAPPAEAASATGAASSVAGSAPARPASAASAAIAASGTIAAPR